MTSHEELQRRATSILEELRPSQGEIQNKVHRQPVFVEFSGTPKSGKSTCIEIVRHFFRRLDYNVLAPAEGASRRTPYYLKDHLMAFNTWSASYALMHILEGLHGSDRYDLAILDRGLFDALAWFELLAARREIPIEVRDQVQNFLQIEDWRSKIDVVLLFTTDAETAMEREDRDKLIIERGQAMNPKFLTELNGAYAEVERKYANRFSRFEPIDTSGSQNTDPVSTAAAVARIILEIFEKKLSATEERPS